MSPSWSRLSKTDAKPVTVPESSSAFLISSGATCAVLSPLSGQRNRRTDKRHWPQPAGGVVRIVRGPAGEFPLGPWPLAGDAPPATPSAGQGEGNRWLGCKALMSAWCGSKMPTLATAADSGECNHVASEREFVAARSGAFGSDGDRLEGVVIGEHVD